MQKTKFNNLMRIFRASKKMSFSYFLKVALNHEKGCAPIPFRIFVNHANNNIQFNPYATHKMELFMTKEVNG